MKKTEYAIKQVGDRYYPVIIDREAGGHYEIKNPLTGGIVDAQSAKTAGVGGEQRGFDGGKKVRGRKRHILVDTEGRLVEARVHSARVPDQDGIKRLLDPARDRLPRLSYPWVDAGYRGRGKEWAEEALGVEVEVVDRSPKPPPEKVLRVWAREWF
jgi:putative transposase